MGFSTDLASVAVVILQGGILAILLIAVRRGNGAAVVNALVAFAATLLPLTAEVAARLALARSVTVGPELPLWIAAAGCLHAFGMLGPYDSIWWWDVLTHAVSAALVAALVYAGAIVVDPAVGVAAATVAFTFVVGVFWELAELIARAVGDRYDVEPVLVQYGWRDTAADLVVDVAGALAVVLLDVRVFVPIAEQAPGVTRTLGVGGGATLVVGSIAMALGVGLDDR